MRAINTILSAVSAVLLALALVFFVRSYFRFDGILHYTEAGAPGVATGFSGNNVTADVEFKGRSSGLISHRGQLTWVSITTPIPVGDWEHWGVPTDQPFASGPMNIVWDLREMRGVGAGSSKTRSGIRDPVTRITWQLPYAYGTAPYWILVIVLGILPYRWVAGYVRSARTASASRNLKGDDPV